MTELAVVDLPKQGFLNPIPFTDISGEANLIPQIEAQIVPFLILLVWNDGTSGTKRFKIQLQETENVPGVPGTPGAVRTDQPLGFGEVTVYGPFFPGQPGIATKDNKIVFGQDAGGTGDGVIKVVPLNPRPGTTRVSPQGSGEGD